MALEYRWTQVDGGSHYDFEDLNLPTHPPKKSKKSAGKQPLALLKSMPPAKGTVLVPRANIWVLCFGSRYVSAIPGVLT